VQRPAEAVALALKLRPDPILIDLETRVMDGVEATREIIGRPPSARIIATSGSD
jgi:CheY-like chemotaxis protein